MKPVPVVQAPRGSTNYHQRELCMQLWQLRTNFTLCDVALKVGGTLIPAHRIVLCASSPVLLIKFAILNHPMGSYLDLSSACVSFDTCHSVLEYMYTGVVPNIPKKRLPELEWLVDHWQLTSLQAKLAAKLKYKRGSSARKTLAVSTVSRPGVNQGKAIPVSTINTNALDHPYFKDVYKGKNVEPGQLLLKGDTSDSTEPLPISSDELVEQEYCACECKHESDDVGNDECQGKPDASEASGVSSDKVVIKEEPDFTELLFGSNAPSPAIQFAVRSTDYHQSPTETENEIYRVLTNSESGKEVAEATSSNSINLESAATEIEAQSVESVQTPDESAGDLEGNLQPQGKDSNFDSQHQRFAAQQEEEDDTVLANSSPTKRVTNTVLSNEKDSLVNIIERVAQNTELEHTNGTSNQCKEFSGMQQFQAYDNTLYRMYHDSTTFGNGTFLISNATAKGDPKTLLCTSTANYSPPNISGSERVIVPYVSQGENTFSKEGIETVFFTENGPVQSVSRHNAQSDMRQGADTNEDIPEERSLHFDEDLQMQHFQLDGLPELDDINPNINGQEYGQGNLRTLPDNTKAAQHCLPASAELLNIGVFLQPQIGKDKEQDVQAVESIRPGPLNIDKQKSRSFQFPQAAAEEDQTQKRVRCPEPNGPQVLRQNILQNQYEGKPTLVLLKIVPHTESGKLQTESHAQYVIAKDTGLRQSGAHPMEYLSHGVTRLSPAAVHLPQLDYPTCSLPLDISKLQASNALLYVPALQPSQGTHRLPPEKPHEESQHLTSEGCANSEISKMFDMSSGPWPVASLAKAQSSENLYSKQERKTQSASEVIQTSLREDNHEKTSNISFPSHDTDRIRSEQSLPTMNEAIRTFTSKKKSSIVPSPLKKVKHTLKCSPAKTKTKCIHKVVLTQLSKDGRKTINISNPQENGSEREQPKTLLLRNKTSDIDSDLNTLGEVVTQKQCTTTQYFPTVNSKNNSFQAQASNMKYRLSSPSVQADGNAHQQNHDAAEKVACNYNERIPQEKNEKQELQKQKINQIGERLLAELQNKTGHQRLWYKGNEFFCKEVAHPTSTEKADGIDEHEPDQNDGGRRDKPLDLSLRTASQTETTEKVHPKTVKTSTKKSTAVQHQNSPAKPESENTELKYNEANHHSQDGEVEGPLTRCHINEPLKHPCDSKRQKGNVGKCVLMKKMQCFHPTLPKRLKLQNGEQFQMSSGGLFDGEMLLSNRKVAEEQHRKTFQGMQNTNTGLNGKVQSSQVDASKKVGIENIIAEKTSLLQNASAVVKTTNCKTSDQPPQHGRKKKQSKVVKRLLLKKLKLSQKLQVLQQVQHLEPQNRLLQSLMRRKYDEQMSSARNAKAANNRRDNTGIKVFDVLRDRKMSNSSELSSVKNNDYNISNRPEPPIVNKEGCSMIRNSESASMRMKEDILDNNPESPTAKAQAYNSDKNVKPSTVKDQGYNLSKNLILQTVEVQDYTLSNNDRPSIAMAEDYNLSKAPEAPILTLQDNNLDENPDSPNVKVQGYNLSKNPEPTVTVQDCYFSENTESPSGKMQDCMLSNNPEPPTVKAQEDGLSKSLTPPTISMQGNTNRSNLKLPTLIAQDCNISTNPKSPTTKAQATDLSKSQIPPAGKTQACKFSNLLISPIVMASIKQEPPMTKMAEDSSISDNPHQWTVKSDRDEQYLCTDCLMLFEDYALLTVHRKCFHTKTERFNCNICKLSFETESKLQTHDTEHHWRDGMEIDLTIDTEDGNVEWHQQTDRKVEHADLSPRYKMKKQVQECSSQETRKNAVLYNCNQPDCAYTTHKMKVFSKHRELHTVIPAKKRRLVTCEQCGKSYLNARCLAKHKTRDHRQVKAVASERLRCTLCTFTSLSKSNLAEHLWKKHDLVKEGKARYKCLFCGFKTLQSSIFKIHKTTHKPGQTEDKQFVCNVCGKRYHKANGLKKHMKYHAGDAKLYQCPHCDYVAVNNKTTLQTHIQLIHEHKGEKRFLCDECDHACNYKGNLYKHQRQVHKKEPCVKDKGNKTTQKNANSSVQQKKAQRKTKKEKKYQAICKAALNQSKPYIVL